LTPHEFGLALDAWEEEREATMYRTAIHAAWILQGLGVKPRQTPEKLLGKHRDLKEFESKEELKAYYRNKQKRINAEVL
jgi:hypothetical protein